MKRYTIVFLVSLFIGVGLVHNAGANGVREVKREKDFYRKIERAPFSIGMFYVEDKEDRDWQRNIARQKRDFKLVSSARLYRDGDVAFVGIDVAKRGLEDMDDEFDVTKLPTFIVFRYGRPLRDAQKKIVMHVGFASDEELRKFINSHLRIDIEKYIQKVAERKAEERARNAAYFYSAWDYPYYGYPYYYGGYGYYGYPYVGFGFGVGF